MCLRRVRLTMSIEIRATLEIVRVYKSLKKKYPEEYLEIQELKKVIVIRPMLGDKIQKKLWPKKYAQHGISNLFRLELSDGWRLL